ncbi:DUF1266 domain-containing protein [Streptomyces sp. adm13(2018)]|uniref:DUF1266 domain-containing protein n=1 Tax=Streptomyces sp. adm13(2018) TaxID=2479007 RepID=UPI0011CD91BF|nr:DUF1266 domain-containing protein [Streptomyces sp. adm13(2018)]TXS11963.1 DUF1266 domain-containing protein [Streptomyces sp. adm13(2018)]
MSSRRTPALRAASWIPPSETEQRLQEASLRGDFPGQIRALADAELFIAAPRAAVDAAPDDVHWPPRQTAKGLLVREILTRGMLPPWHPDLVFHAVTLRWVAEFPWRDPRLLLAVDHGTPAELLLPTTPEHRAGWLRAYSERERAAGDRFAALRHGPLHGPLAFGLACGAHLAFRNGVPWNDVGSVYSGYTQELDSLREAWGVTGREGWRKELDALLDGRNSPPEPDFALRVREELRHARGAVPTPDAWRETAAGHAQDLGAGPAAVRGIEELVRRIVRYEARFRAEGLLAPDGRVRRTVAYDYGRAVNLARWGLSARFCAPPEAEQAIVHAGALARSAYASWEEYSAGYALGRVLRFDGEEYGCFHEGNVAAHRTLTAHEGSPWRHIPWR